MAKKNNKPNLSDYLKNINSRDKLDIPTKEDKVTITDLIKEGNKLLEEEEKLKGKVAVVVDDKKKLDTALSTSSTNPYIKARIKVLNDWLKNPATAWLAHEIEAMEAGTYPKDRHYDEFVRMVRELGDTI